MKREISLEYLSKIHTRLNENVSKLLQSSHTYNIDVSVDDRDKNHIAIHWNDLSHHNISKDQNIPSKIEEFSLVQT